MIRTSIAIFISVCLLLLGPKSTIANSFEDRIQLANELNDHSEYKYYQYQIIKSLGKKFNKTLNGCYSITSFKLPPSIEIVANIDHNGIASDIDILPVTKNSACILSGISKFKFPTPPNTDREQGYPLHFKLRIVSIKSSSSSPDER